MNRRGDTEIVINTRILERTVWLIIIVALIAALWWRWDMNGAGTDAVRAAIYFPARSLRSPLLILAVWSVAGIAAMVLIGRARTPGTLAELEAGLAAI